MQSNRTFMRNALCYFIPFFIMTILAIVSLNYTFQMMQSQNHDIVQTQLQSSMWNIEDQLYESRQIALEISMDSNLSKEKLSDRGIMTIKGMDRLGEYRWRMGLLSSLFLTYDPEKVVTDDGTASMKTYCEALLKVTEEDWKKVAEMMLKRDSASCVLERKDGVRILFLLYYYPESTYIDERWVGLAVDTSKIEKQMQNVLGDMDSSLVLTYEEQVITEIDQLSTALPASDRLAIFDSGIAGKHSLSGYAEMEFQGRHRNMFMRVLLNKSVFAQTLKKEQLKMFAISITAFLLLSLFLWFYNRYQYMKAKAVQLIAVDLYPELARNKVRGEYEFIRRVLERDVERLKHSDQMLEYFRAESKRQLTWLLLKNDLPEEIQIDELIENCGIEVPGSYYVVLEFLMAKDNIITDMLEDMSQVLLYHTEKCNRGTVLMAVVSLTSRDETHAERFILAEKILQKFSIAGYLCKGVASGLVYEDIRDIHSSQEEAFSLIELLNGDRTKEKVKIAFFDETTQMSKRVPHSTADLLLQFKECLMNNKEKEAEALLDDLLIPSKKITQELLIYSRYKVIQILVGEMKSKEASTQMIEKFLLLMNLEDSIFKAEIKRYINLLCVREEANTVEVDAEQVLKFIEDHAFDNQLSMDMITEQIGISESSIRRIMKRRLDKSYKEYITEIRLKKASELLRDTDFDVQTIVTQVGYHNVPSFNRLFKITYGTSPGEYRMQNQEAEQ